MVCRGSPKRLLAIEPPTRYSTPSASNTRTTRPIAASSSVSPSFMLGQGPVSLGCQFGTQPQIGQTAPQASWRFVRITLTEASEGKKPSRAVGAQYHGQLPAGRCFAKQFDKDGFRCRRSIFRQCPHNPKI